MKYDPRTEQGPMRYAVVRRWKDNPNDSQVLEYFHTRIEAEKWMRRQAKDIRYRDEVAMYE